ncbi:MAG TPA: hypothetical protein VGE76_11745, partial [Opitutaceae bacterium]
AALAASVSAQTQAQLERIQASYLLAFGKKATEAEVGYWSKQSAQSISDLIANHQRYLKQDVGTHRATIKRSYIDALGREPNDGEYKHWLSGSDTYTQLMKNHVAWLRGNPAEYEKVIRRSYRLVLNSTPSAAEINYWKGQGTLSYAMLAAAHDWWKKQNPSGNGKPAAKATIAPASTTYLTVAPVSAAVAAEAIKAAGLIGNDGGSLVGNDGASLVAAGGGHLVAAGGGNLVAAGGGNLVAAGAGN